MRLTKPPAVFPGIPPAALAAGGEKVISLGRMIARGEDAPGVVYKGTLGL